MLVIASLLFTALCLFLMDSIGDWAGEIVATFVIMLAYSTLMQASWAGYSSGSPFASLWHIALSAGTIGLTAWYANDIIYATSDIPVIVTQLKILITLIVTPLVVAGAPLIRWLYDWYVGVR